MDFNYSMTCVDRDGVKNDFKYSIETDVEGGFEKIIYRAMPSDVNVDDWFEFSIVKISNNTAKVVAMNNNGIPELRGKGIPEKLIEIAASQFSSTIVSSSNKSTSKKMDNEWRSTAASKMWDRLVKNNMAKYDDQLDIYTYQNGI